MCDRSPLGEVEVVPICHRVMQHSNWKFFMENQLDALHPSVTHQSTGISAGRVEKRLKAEKGAAPLYYHYLSTFASSFEQWDSVQTINFPHGHGILKAYMGLRPRDPDTLEYEALLKNAYGEAKTEEYLSRSIHHVLVYPVPLGAVAAAAAALPAAGRRPTRRCRRSGTSASRARRRRSTAGASGTTTSSTRRRR